VFWGAAESRHLVDVINQRDPDPRPGRDAKLGQPMVNLAVIGAWGTLDVFAMPFFRKRSFWGRDAYRNTTAPVAADRAKVEELPLDVATRYGHTLGNWDVGMTYFYGRDRDPRFDQETDAGMPILVPLYDRVHRVGIDAQGVTGTWLWKVEAMIRLGGTDDYVAVVSGTEYSVREYLSAIAEIAVDSRGSRATTAVEHDAYLAARLLLHDASVEVGAHVDVVHGNTALSMTGEHRLGPSQTISLSARIHVGDRVNDPRFAPRLDNRVSLILRRFF
jgi:hypothetical protein